MFVTEIKSVGMQERVLVQCFYIVSLHLYTSSTTVVDVINHHFCKNSFKSQS